MANTYYETEITGKFYKKIIFGIAFYTAFLRLIVFFNKITYSIC